MSKYEPLWKYLKEANKENYKLSYDEIKEIINVIIETDKNVKVKSW